MIVGRGARLAVLAIAIAELALPGIAHAAGIPDWLTLELRSRPSPDQPQSVALPSAENVARWKKNGHGYVDLLWRIEITSTADGSISSRGTTVRYFLSEAGIQQAANMEIWVDASRETGILEIARSVGPDGTARNVKPETIQILDDTQPGVFSDWQRVMAPMPGLEPGSVAILSGSRQLQARDYPLKWARIFSIGSVSPVARTEVVIEHQPGAPRLEWATDDENFECEELKPDLTRCIRGEVPALRVETDVASYLDLMPQFFIGYPQTTSELRRDVRRLVDRAAQPTPAIRAQVEALGVAEEPDVWQKLLAIHRFVADEIRYVSLAHGDSSVVPHAASLTLERRYGDCKDKVSLLVAMARVAGLDVTPVLTHSSRYDVSRVLRPSSGYFDHMVACMDEPRGGVVCVDPTEANSGLGVAPSIAGAIALALRREGPAEVGHLPIPPIGWDFHSESRVSLGCDGSVREATERRLTGPGSTQIRNQLLGLATTQQRDWAINEFKEAMGSIGTPEVRIDGLYVPTEPIGITTELTLPGQYVVDNPQYLGFDAWLVYYGRAVLSNNRYHAYRFGGLRYTANTHVRVCNAKIDHHGAKLGFESLHGRLERSHELVDGDLTIHTTLEIPAAVIPARELRSFETFVMQALRESGYWFSWRPEGA